MLKLRVGGTCGHTTLVGVTLDLEEAVVAPLRTPRVLYLVSHRSFARSEQARLGQTSADCEWVSGEGRGRPILLIFLWLAPPVHNYAPLTPHRAMREQHTHQPEVSAVFRAVAHREHGVVHVLGLGAAAVGAEHTRLVEAEVVGAVERDAGGLVQPHRVLIYTPPRIQVVLSASLNLEEAWVEFVRRRVQGPSRAETRPARTETAPTD